jgi:hypothetical protein
MLSKVTVQSTSFGVLSTPVPGEQAQECNGGKVTLYL